MTEETWRMHQIEIVQRCDAPRMPSYYRSAAEDRYVAALVVGYGDDIGEASCTSPQEAAALARELVQGGGTCWTVLDRKTGQISQWEDMGPSKPAKPSAHDALRALCTTIENTGGLLHPTEDEDGNVPVTDPDWADLGDAYLAACAALGREPVYSATKLCVKCGAEIPRPVLAAGTSERCVKCGDPDPDADDPDEESATGACPKCGSLSPWRCEHAEENARAAGIKIEFTCKQCKGRNVEIARWVDPNTNKGDEDVFDASDLEGYWCRDCKDHVDLLVNTDGAS